jgi:dephospho-CoA kinase
MNASSLVFKHIGKSVVIALAGLQLTRKREASIIAKQYGFMPVSLGDFVREQSRLQYGEACFGSVTKVSLEYQREAEGVLIGEALAQLTELTPDCRGVIIDSIKSHADLNYLREICANVIVIGFVSSTKDRISRRDGRIREDDAPELSDFYSRDNRELKMGLGNIIVEADFHIVAKSIESTQRQIEEVFSVILNSLD